MSNKDATPPRAYTIAVPYRQVFTPDECEEMIEMGESRYMGDGMMFGRDGNPILVPEMRICKARDIKIIEPGWRGYAQRLDDLIRRANAATWAFDITTFEEPFKFTRYDEGGHFNRWHVDAGHDYTERRKLTAIVQLSPPTAYEGGLLEMRPSCGSCLTDTLAQGSVLVFPAYRVHRVIPVTKGTRYSLITWMSGPPLR